MLAALGFGYDDRKAAALTFPLEGSVYYVAQGGNSTLLNYHNTNRAQKFALDVVELNAAATRAAGIYPSRSSRYAVFGAEIHSPCEGEITEAVNAWPDLKPPETDRAHPAGNHVVVRCAEEDVNVELAHMKEGSVAVEQGESVDEGKLLGRVGNTGNTTEPHLHVHAVRTGSGSTSKGEGVPIVFNDRFLVRNDLISR